MANARVHHRARLFAGTRNCKITSMKSFIHGTAGANSDVYDAQCGAISFATTSVYRSGPPEIAGKDFRGARTASQTSPRRESLPGRPEPFLCLGTGLSIHSNHAAIKRRILKRYRPGGFLVVQALQDAHTGTQVGHPAASWGGAPRPSRNNLNTITMVAHSATMRDWRLTTSFRYCIYALRVLRTQRRDNLFESAWSS